MRKHSWPLPSEIYCFRKFEKSNCTIKQLLQDDVNLCYHTGIHVGFTWRSLMPLKSVSDRSSRSETIYHCRYSLFVSNRNRFQPCSHEFHSKMKRLFQIIARSMRFVRNAVKIYEQGCDLAVVDKGKKLWDCSLHRFLCNLRHQSAARKSTRGKDDAELRLYLSRLCFVQDGGELKNVKLLFSNVKQNYPVLSPLVVDDARIVLENSISRKKRENA